MRDGELRDKVVIVVGLGASGYAAARALINCGARVWVTESGSSPSIEQRAQALRAANATVQTGGHGGSLPPADVAVVSPGIPPSSSVIQELRRRGIGIIGEVELAYRLGSCDFLAVTGTNGKTTTTSLLAAMLQEGGMEAVAAGNIGLPLVEAVGSMTENGVAVAEVSSFQLDTIEHFRPRVAVLLNIAEDHLDWHASFDDYVAAKARVVENQHTDDFFVFNDDDANAVRIAKLAPSRTVPFSARRPIPDGVGVQNGHITFRGAPVLMLDALRLPGLPGIEDTAAALGAALACGVQADAVERAVRGFGPLRHRLELVAHLDGVDYIDDSKATNPHATLAAVKDLREVVLIAGGRSKGIDLSPLARAVPPVSAVVAIGEATEAVERAFAGKVPVVRARSMTEAVRRAHSQAIRGGSVLLSPGCASLDMFESYAARGEAFARAVEEIVEGAS